MHQTVRPRRDGRRARHFEARTSVASFGCERSGGMASSNGGWNGGVPANGGGTMQPTMMVTGGTAGGGAPPTIGTAPPMRQHLQHHGNLQQQQQQQHLVERATDAMGKATLTPPPMQGQPPVYGGGAPGGITPLGYGGPAMHSSAVPAPPTQQPQQQRTYPQHQPHLGGGTMMGGVGTPPIVGGGAVGAGVMPPQPGIGAPVMPGAPQPGYAQPLAANRGGSTSRIDPSQIPRPVHVSHAEKVRYNTRSEMDQSTHPPSALVEYVGVDLGSANPRYMRSTISSVPNTGDLLTTSGMPLSIMTRPMALPHPEEAPIQVIDNGAVGPVRCGRCKAYMNPYMRFIDHMRFECNFCHFVTEVPPDYMCNLGADGKRTDWTERQELCRGSVEYVAPAEYMVRPPMAPAYLFLIEVTAQAIQSGVTTSACEVILRTLDSIQGAEHALVSIATVDSSIHFYHVKEGAEKPSMLVVPDVDDSYAPLKSGLLMPLAKNREAIEKLLKTIPESFSSSAPGPNASTAGIKSAIECLKPTGGKVMAFLATIPNVGIGKLEARTSTTGQRTGNIEKEPLRCMASVDKNYHNMAMHAAEHQVCIDVFLCVSSSVDVATLGVLPRMTGGSLYRYPGFNVEQDFAQLHNDLRWNLIRPQALEAVMRVRASAGLGVQDYNGFFCKRTMTDIDLPALDSDKTIAVTLRYEDKLVDGKEAYVQCALLYTTMSRERRIRVHTIALPITSVLGSLFRAADLDAQITWAVRKSAYTLLTGNGTLTAAKDASLQQCIATLYAYRRFCASNNSSGQLILPEGLKTLPLYVLGLHKSHGLRSDASPDDRAMWLYRALVSPPELMTPAVYPRLFSVHDLPKDSSFPPIPPSLWLSAEKLSQDGAYLLDDGQEILLWIGRQLPVEILRDLFGTENVDDIASSRATVPSFDNPTSKALNDFINAIRKQRGAFLRTRILKRGDSLEALFYNRLSEDRSPAGMSYVEFLCHCHRLIMNKSN